MRRLIGIGLALALGGALVGCGRSDPEDEEFDFNLDASGSRLDDAGTTDAKLDGDADATSDAKDGGTDVKTDAPLDVAKDVQPDQSFDAPQDQGSDVSFDAPIDVSKDAPNDVSKDAPKDGPKDATKDQKDFFDAFPFPDSGPIATCAECAQQACSTQINKCFNNQNCVDGVVCAFTQCFSGGQPSFGCLLGCFNGHFGAMFQALGAFQCVINNCGQDCAGVVGGGGGGLPGGGLPGGGPVPGGAPGALPPAGTVGFPIEIPSDFVWPDGIVPPASPIVIPPPQAFDAYPGVIPACGAWLRPACEPAAAQ